MDGQLIELIVHALAAGALWNIGAYAGELARTDLASLLKVSSVRHALRAHTLPGFVYSERDSYRKLLEICVKKIVKADKDKQEVDLQAELRASWAVIVSVQDHRNIWDRLRTIIPKFAFLAGFVDPIRYAGPLVHGLIELALYSYDEYQDAKSRSLARQTGALSLLYLQRLNFSLEDASLLWEMHNKCNRWNTAVLIVRLAATVLEERIVPLGVRQALTNLLVEMSGFKHFYFRNNWKVRRTVLLHLQQLSQETMEKVLYDSIHDTIEMRSLLETEPAVRAVLGRELDLAAAKKKLQQPAYKDKVERELEALGEQVRQMNKGLTYRSEHRATVVAAEVAEMSRNYQHCHSMLASESLKTQEISVNVNLLHHRTLEIATDISHIKELLEQPHSPKTLSPVLRILPQKNLEGCGFVGRSEELSQLISMYSSKSARAVILGKPGVGKSTLALKFAYEAEKAGLFTHFVWINAEKSTTIFNDYLEVASDLQVSHGNDCDKVKYAKSTLKTNPSTLLIYDNADFEDQRTEEEIAAFLKDHFLFGAASVLVTSRNELWLQHIHPQVKLQALTQPQGIQLIAGLSGLPEEEFGPALMDMFEGNPLSIRGFGHYLRQSKSRVDLERRLGKMTKGSALDKLLELYYQDCSDLGRKALESCSFLNPANIDSRLTLRILLRLKAQQQTSAVSELKSLSLLEMGRPGALEMHRVVQDSVHSHIQESEELERVVAKCILEMIDEGLIKDPSLMLNARFFHDRRREMLTETYEGADERLLKRKQKTLDRSKKIDAALVKFCLREKLAPEARRVSQAWAALPPKEDFSQASDSAVRRKPVPTAASSVQAVEVIPTVEEVKERMSNGKLFLAEDRFEDAEREYRAAAALAEEHHVKQYVLSMYRLARIMQERDKGPAGREFILMALSKLEEAQLSPKAQIHVYDLAGILLGQSSDRTNDAIAYFQRAIALGQTHKISFSYLAKLQTHLADVYLQTEQREEAIQIYEASLETLRPVPTDPLHAQIHENLSHCHQLDWGLQLDHLEKELGFRKQHLRDDPAGEASNLFKAGALLAKNNDNSRAIQKLEDAEKLLQPGDPQLAEVYDELMLTCSNVDEEKAVHYYALKQASSKSG